MLKYITIYILQYQSIPSISYIILVHYNLCSSLDSIIILVLQFDQHEEEEHEVQQPAEEEEGLLDKLTHGLRWCQLGGHREEVPGRSRCPLPQTTTDIWPAYHQISGRGSHAGIAEDEEICKGLWVNWRHWYAHDSRRFWLFLGTAAPWWRWTK